MKAITNTTIMAMISRCGPVIELIVLKCKNTNYLTFIHKITLANDAQKSLLCAEKPVFRHLSITILMIIKPLI
jgi:hypothetical protein